MRRVVVTGMGVVTPIGNTVSEMWDSIQNNKCGIGKITCFDTENCEAKLAAEVKGFQPEKYLKPLEIKRMDKFSQLAIAASIQAYNESGLQEAEIDRERFSVFYGSGIGGESIFKENSKLCELGFKSVSKMTLTNNLINMAAANIAIRLKALGSCITTVTACASGTDSIGRAYRDIKDGYSDIALAGAADSAINPIYVAGFTEIGALSLSSDPLRASIPFDKERDGFVLGEGAGSLILEEYMHAKNRGAEIFGEISGYGATCDAFSLTAPDFSLKQGSRAMKNAIEEACILPNEISYINAHGTGTKYNDEYETKIIKNIFGEYSSRVAVSSTKSFMGHLLGAAGAVEAVITIKSLIDSYIPPTIGYLVPDGECDLDYVIGNGRKQNMKYAISNSLGFGGHNSTLILKKWCK